MKERKGKQVFVVVREKRKHSASSGIHGNG